MDPIFLSYTHRDSAIADPIEWALERSYYSVWRDVNETRAGNVLSREVTAAIADCSFFLSLITPNFEISGWMENELTKAQEYRKPVVAIICGDREVPIQVGSLTRIHVPLKHGILSANEFTRLVNELENSFGDPSDSSCAEEEYDEFTQASQGDLLSELPGTRWSWCENGDTEHTGKTITFHPNGELIRSWRANPTRWEVTSNGFVRVTAHVLKFDLDAGVFQGCSARDQDAPVERSGTRLQTV